MHTVGHGTGLPTAKGEGLPTFYPNTQLDIEPVVTLRDQFAMAALTGLIAQSPHARSAVEFAYESYLMGDAMLEARNPKKESE